MSSYLERSYSYYINLLYKLYEFDNLPNFFDFLDRVSTCELYSLSSQQDINRF